MSVEEKTTIIGIGIGIWIFCIPLVMSVLPMPTVASPLASTVVATNELITTVCTKVGFSMVVFFGAIYFIFRAFKINLFLMLSKHMGLEYPTQKGE